MKNNKATILTVIEFRLCFLPILLPNTKVSLEVFLQQKKYIKEQIVSLVNDMHYAQALRQKIVTIFLMLHVTPHLHQSPRLLEKVNFLKGQLH